MGFADDQPNLPRWTQVVQHLDSHIVADVSAEIASAISAGCSRPLAGQRVALAVGSRGIDRLDEVVRAVAAEVRRQGAEPFIVPAMGSHGGATAEGQTEVLATLGITEAAMGCQVVSTMETVRLGDLDGLPVWFDQAAAEADAIIPINRVKPHTDFRGPVESGLCKMITIGMGKQRGAGALHAAGFPAFARVIPAVARFTLAHLPIPLGIALVENGYGQLSLVEAVPAARMVEREAELLTIARQKMPLLPVAACDVLIVDQIGKEITGAGMDPNVTGRNDSGPLGSPQILRIIVRDLTAATEGNATGLGLADVALERVAAKVDRHKTYMNCITSKTPESARLPMLAANDREALAMALACCVGVEPASARIIRIQDTKHLERMYVSESLLPEVLATGSCTQVEDLRPIAFDADGFFKS